MHYSRYSRTAVPGAREPRSIVPTQRNARLSAELERTVSGPEKALEVIEASELDVADPANSVLLRQLVETLVSLGRGDEALAWIDAALARDGERASTRELHGTALARLGRIEEARGAYQRALALDGENAPALAGLGTLVFFLVGLMSLIHPPFARRCLPGRGS